MQQAIVSLPRSSANGRNDDQRPLSRSLISVVNQMLCALQLEKHPDKTYIGRVEKGFDFLSYHITPEGLEVATPTLERFVERALRLYEQEPGEPLDSSRLGAYVRRWLRWRDAGF